MEKAKLRVVKFKLSESDDYKYGSFHQWTINSYHSSNTMGHCAVAIVEDSEGFIHLIHTENIKFLN